MRAVLRWVFSLGDRYRKIPCCLGRLCCRLQSPNYRLFLRCFVESSVSKRRYHQLADEPHQELLEETVSCGAFQRRSRAFSSGGDSKRVTLVGLLQPILR